MIKKFYHWCIRLVPIIALVLLIIELVVTNELAVSGNDVRALDLAMEQIEEENDFLIQRIASASSLFAITDQSKLMGFHEPATRQVISLAQEQFPVALNSPR